MKPFTKSVAVLVGINQYGNGINRLRTPIADVERLGAILADKHGYAVEPIVKNATKAELQTLLARLPALATRGARLLFYFAGHGLAEDSQAEPAGYLVPSDARHNDLGSCLPMRELYQALLQIECRHVLIILDCCFAGAFRWGDGTRSLKKSGQRIYKERYERYLRSPAWQVITSAAHDERALDVLAGHVLGERGRLAGLGPGGEPLPGASFPLPCVLSGTAVPGRDVGRSLLARNELRRVAAWAHICGFMAGAIRIGLSEARSRVEARSSASPAAIFAIRSAVAGACPL